MNKFIFSPIFALILGLANNLIVPFCGRSYGFVYINYTNNAFLVISNRPK